MQEVFLARCITMVYETPPSRLCYGKQDPYPCGKSQDHEADCSL